MALYAYEPLLTTDGVRPVPRAVVGFYADTDADFTTPLEVFTLEGESLGFSPVADENGYINNAGGYMLPVQYGKSKSGKLPAVPVFSVRSVIADAKGAADSAASAEAAAVNASAKADQIPTLVTQATASNSTVVQAAAAAVDANPKIAELEGAKWVKPSVSSSTGQDADNYTTAGFIGILNSSIKNLPVATLGALEVLPFGTVTIQRYTTWEAVPRTFSRRLASGAWSAWTEGALGSRLNTLELDKWKRPNLVTGEDFNSVLSVGAAQVVAQNHPNQPIPSLGVLEVLPLNTWRIQRFTTADSKPRVYVRRFASNVWGAWELQPTRAELDVALNAAQRQVSGMKVVPLTMTAPGTPLSTTTDKGAVRWVRRYAVMPKRVRVHIANANTGNALKGDRSLSLSHIRVGVGDANGGLTQAVVAQAGGGLVFDGSEVVTQWVTVPGLTDGGYINVSVGWYGGGGSALLQHNQGGGWIANDNAMSGSATTDGWARSQTTPLHCWIEAEVPTSTPVIVAQGDSITIGTASADPVGDSWAAVYAYNTGGLPVILAQHGSTMTNWAAGSSRWTQYGTFPLASVADAVVTAMGQNDLAGSGVDLEVLKTRHEAFMSALRSTFPSQPVYLGDLTPSNKTAAVEQVRRSFNEWRATLPFGERGVLDFARAVGGSDNENLLPELSADGLHPNTEGQRSIAAVVEAAPVTPFSLTPSQLKAIVAS